MFQPLGNICDWKVRRAIWTASGLHEVILSCNLRKFKAGFDTGYFARGGGGGETVFLRNFENFRTVIIILVIVYSSAIDQFKYSHFVCLPVYHIL